MKKQVLMIALVSSIMLRASAMEDSIEQAQWNNCPTELKRHILSYVAGGKEVNLKVLLDCSLVNKDFKSIIDLWRLNNLKQYKSNTDKKLTAHALFLKAIEQGDYESVQTLIDLGIDVNAQEAVGMMEKMSINGFGSIMASKDGAIAQSKQYGTPLMTAVSFGHLPVVKLLISKGADVNDRDKLSRTALIFSANGRKGIAELLINNGCDVNVQDRAGRTPLMWAAELGHAELVMLFILKGADLSVVDFRGKSALVLAQENKHQDVADLLSGDEWQK